MSVPAYLAATTGQAPKSAHASQFLGAHPATYLYTGVQQGGQTTLGSGSVNTNGTYLAQKFTVGASGLNLGRIVLTLALTGAPPPTTISIQTNSGTAPSGTALAAAALPAQMAPASAATVSIPLPCALSASTVYWIVASSAGDASDYFAWSKSNQTSGASSSATGTSWTAQAYGLYFSYWDRTAPAGAQPLHTYADSGSRWSTWTWNASLQPATVQEYTAGQTATGYMYSSRTLTYTTGNLQTIA